MLVWNSVLDFLNSKIISSNFLDPPDGRILKNATLSTGITSWNSNMRFLLLCKSRVEFCFAFLELENYFFKFSCLAGWQHIKKCFAIIWNSVIQFQHSMPFVVQVTKFSWADEAARQILFQAMLAWNFALEFQNSNAICLNFLGAPDGRRMTNPKQFSGIPL